MNDIGHAIETIRARIGRACEAAGRDPAYVTLIAVTKTVDAVRVDEAIKAGIRDIGENYVQEAKRKIEMIGPGRIRWHMIGHVQSNKIKYLPVLFDCVHTVDRPDMLDKLDRYGKPMDILFEVNIAGERSKSGTDIEGLEKVLEKARSLKYLRPVGLMTMPPYTEDPEDARPFFRKLRETLTEMNQKFSLDMKELSMGMSSDFEIAVQEGATMVRIGTALFGARS
ncbi:MAG: YggS family pyridoxal phosphate-dependent enzyme [Syntrophorhabdaceae bacterium]|nr:YggS family pyridoxal phosphate-dependent enzyme [Syntrophorhabdaceae bacterium]MDD4196170.1 YggS family pyridoxal phosphate-dependent enzyme [Syntrophorhabdaceae bacterium]